MIVTFQINQVIYLGKLKDKLSMYERGTKLVLCQKQDIWRPVNTWPRHRTHVSKSNPGCPREKEGSQPHQLCQTGKHTYDLPRSSLAYQTY
jgi:hypothetical protein